MWGDDKLNTVIIINEYIIRILPSFILAIIILVTIKPTPLVRVGVYIMVFIVMRDTLTPLKLWYLGTEGFIWIRLYNDPIYLIIVGLLSAVLLATVYFFDKDNRKFFIWFRGRRVHGILAGILTAILVVIPFLIMYRHIPIEQRGGEVSSSLIVPILVFALLGNLLEEGLFRGLVLGHLEINSYGIKSGILSGLIFSFCHIFLATTVTSIGLPIIIFTSWEGIIAGIVGAKYGVIPSTLTHGGAIFILSSGLI